MGKEGVTFFGREGTGKPAPEREPEPKPPVIPIIFVPGVMGSNLRVQKGWVPEVKGRFEVEGRGDDFTDKAWRPPNATYSAGVAWHHFKEEIGGCDSWTVRSAKKWESYGPKLRQVLLNPATTEVDVNGTIPDSLAPLRSAPDLIAVQEARRRGWGSIHWQSYGKFLCFLENTMTFAGKYYRLNVENQAMSLKITRSTGKGWKLPGTVVPTDLELSNAASFIYPVFAFGYNWSQSNLTSARALLKKIENWIQEYRKAGHDCNQVILVTHSMGGLVGRAASKLDKNNLILGIVHGVMPATGAPILYRRMVAGWESGKRAHLLPELKSVIVPLGGRTAAETTPVIANAPGVLELLPSHLYPSKWLSVEWDLGGGKVRDVFSLPMSDDPYQEIYLQKDVWWRLVDPLLLDPAQLHSKTEEGIDSAKAWKAYERRIRAVKEFHGAFLGEADYHDPGRTFVYYGEGIKSFSTICWRLPKDSIPLSPVEVQTSNGAGGDLLGRRDFVRSTKAANDGSQMFRKSGFNPVSDSRPNGIGFPAPGQTMGADPGFPWNTWSARIQGPRGDGDESVPVESGCAPGRRIANISRLHGFDHQFAYDHFLVRTYTVLAICKLAQHAGPK